MDGNIPNASLGLWPFDVGGSTLQGFVDVDLIFVEVDVLPLEGHGLPRSESGIEHRHDNRVRPVIRAEGFNPLPFLRRDRSGGRRGAFVRLGGFVPRRVRPAQTVRHGTIKQGRKKCRDS